MKAVILAAGKGERLGAITQKIPKPMIKIAGKPVLEHNIFMCKNSGVDEIFINHVEKVSKSYTNFWEDLKKVGFKISPLIDLNNEFHG